MMDGRIGRIALRSKRRATSNADHGYSAKYASGFYGRFRDAVRSASSSQEQQEDQPDGPGNSAEALWEVGLDLAEAPTW